MSRKYFQELQVYKLAERLADEIWKIIGGWDILAKNTIDTQIIRSADIGIRFDS
jgi:hypothetical protein